MGDFVRPCFSLLALMPLMAIAESQSQSRAIALEEVVVTAQKKVESLQDAPISIAAFGMESLEKEGISNIGDLSVKVPNFDVAPFPLNNTTLSLYIRGIGVNAVQITRDPAIGVYSDGVYIARSSGLALDVTELERIEVLRGPQGTLYGRNSTGGAVNIISSKPSTDGFSFKQNLTAGNRDLVRSRTTVNVPLTDDLAVKLGYLYSEQEGFIDNTGLGTQYGEKETQGIRADFLWLATDSLSARYVYDYSEIEATGYSYQSVLPRSAVETTGARTIPYVTEPGVAASSYDNHRVSSMKSAAPMRPNNTEIEGHALILTWDLDWFTVKSLSAYRRLTDVTYADLAGGANFSSLEPGTPGAHFRLDYGAVTFTDAAGTTQQFGQATIDLDHDQVSQEFQFSGSVDNTFEYIVGLYYFKEHASERRPFSHQASTNLLSEDTTTNTNTLQRSVTATGAQFTIENEAWAAFSEMTWSPEYFDERLHVTFGARHSADKRAATRNNQRAVWSDEGEGLRIVESMNLPDSFGQGPDAVNRQWPASAESDYRNDSFTLVTAYDITDDVNGYAKISEGYKSGGYNTREPDSIIFADGFAPETVTNYEIGLKGEFFDRRLRVNAAAFQTDYDDMQFNFVLAGSIGDTRTLNAGTATITGFEIDAMAVLTEGLIATVSYGYLDPNYDEVINPYNDSENGSIGDESDRYVFPQAAQHSYTVGLDYTFEPFSFGQLSANISYDWKDERATTPIIEEVNLETVQGDSSTATNVRGSWIDDYGLLNARMTLSDLIVGQGAFRVALWCKNLEDKEYVVSAISNLPHADRSVMWGDPRSYGLDVIYEY